MIASNLEGYMRVGLDHICFFRNDLYHHSNFLIQVGHLQGKAMKTSMSQQKSSRILKTQEFGIFQGVKITMYLYGILCRELVASAWALVAVHGWFVSSTE